MFVTSTMKAFVHQEFVLQAKQLTCTTTRYAMSEGAGPPKMSRMAEP
jgi:hypothetical protein